MPVYFQPIRVYLNSVAQYALLIIIVDRWDTGAWAHGGGTFWNPMPLSDIGGNSSDQGGYHSPHP